MGRKLQDEEYKDVVLKIEGYVQIDEHYFEDGSDEDEVIDQLMEDIKNGDASFNSFTGTMEYMPGRKIKTRTVTTLE